MRTFARLIVAIVATLGMSGVALAATASNSFAAQGNPKPTITSTQASFTIPSSPTGTYILKLRSLPGETLVGQTQGTSGTLTLSVPTTSTCQFEADVRFIPPGGTTSTLFSSKIATVPGCGTPCPNGTSIHIRWHYSANGTSGSWSATTAFGCPGPVSMGPQSMEGNLHVLPGATLKAGYDFTIPGNNNSVFVTFNNPKVTFNVTCVNGLTPTSSTVTVPMPTQTYNSTNGGTWYPSGDQHSPLVFQGSISVPDLCNGGAVSFQHGGTFTATLS